MGPVLVDPFNLIETEMGPVLVDPFDLIEISQLSYAGGQFSGKGKNTGFVSESEP